MKREEPPIPNPLPGSGGARPIKRVFGFAKVRYRGLNKTSTALANLFMARRHRLRCQPA